MAGRSFLLLMPKLKLSAFRFLRFQSGSLAVCCVRKQSTISDDIKNELGKYSGGTVDLTKDEDTKIATICLNYPEKKNALTGSMMLQLSEAIDKLTTWSVGKGLILHGANDTFCAGADLNMIRKLAQNEMGPEMSLFMQNVSSRLYSMPYWTVSLLQGHCLGGGLELSLGTDFRLSCKNTKIGFVHGKLGLTTGFGGSTLLLQILSKKQALKLLLTSEILDSTKACKIGIIDDILENDENAIEQCISWLMLRMDVDKQIISTM